MRSFLSLCVLGLTGLLLATGGRGAVAAPIDSLQEQIDRASPGDTIVVDGGVFNERITIDKPLFLDGRNYPVIDGGGEGDVVTITADDVTLSRFLVRNSGRSLSQEPAAIKVTEAAFPTIQYNRIEASHFAIHVTGSNNATIAFNEIDAGNGVPQERRGHAIYLWEVESSAVHENTIVNAADGIHLEFSNDNGIGANTVTGSRYGLHFMYSHDNRVIDNTFTDNLSGAVLMFSNNMLLKGNELSNNREGATGAGILLKDVNNIFAEENRIVRNKYGLTAEGSPQEKGATATFIHNLFALNDTGVGLFSSAPVTFIENAMIENTVQVEALSGSLTSIHASDDVGGGSATPEIGGSTSGATGGSAQPTLNGNYWSDYPGHDADGDGIGDQPYRPQPPFAGAMEDNPTLRMFQFTIAQEAIDAAAEMFPIYEYDAVIEDSAPLMSPPGPAMSTSSGVNTSLLVAGVLLLALALGILQVFLDVDPVGAVLGGARRRIAPGGAS